VLPSFLQILFAEAPDRVNLLSLHLNPASGYMILFRTRTLQTVALLREHALAFLREIRHNDKKNDKDVV